MANPRKPAAQVPGDEPAAAPVGTVDQVEEAVEKKPDARLTALNNTVATTANDVGSDRERIVRAQAMADAARRGEEADLAPAADIGKPAAPTSIKRKAVINGVEVEVEVPQVRRNSAVETFGPESKHPRGTPVRKDGTPCEGDEVPHGVIGDINTPQGKLVNRIIPLDAVRSAN